MKFYCQIKMQMVYDSYYRTQQYHEEREYLKRPGQRFCDDIEWQITMNG